MNTKRRYIYLKICMLVMFVWLTACNRDPHEGERGLTVAIDNTQCPDVPIGAIKLYIYGTGKPLRHLQLCGRTGHCFRPASLRSRTLHGSGGHQCGRRSGGDLHPHCPARVVRDRDEPRDQPAFGHSGGECDGGRHQPCHRLPAAGCFHAVHAPSAAHAARPKLPDYTPEKSKTRAAGTANTIRCVAELCKAGTDIVVLHKAVTPVPQADGTYLVELELAEGSYDLRLWTDYARADNPLADTFYHTESLKAVTIVTKPYTANTDAKDAAYYNKSDITLSKEGATMNVQLQRPLAKYRLIAKDVENYRKLMEAKPDIYPPLKNLTVKVLYEGYFPLDLMFLQENQMMP